MNFRIIIYYLTITTLTSCGHTDKNQSGRIVTSDGQTNQELKYLQTRDGNINYFKNLRAKTNSDAEWSKLDRQMDSSSTVLEKMLREIMKTSQIESISQTGKISLSTLLEGDMGFGSLDGLLIEKDSVQIFVTTKFLFNEYFKTEKLNPEDNLKPKQLDIILTTALGGGEARTETLFAEKISSTKSSTVYQIIGGFGQEGSPLMAKCIFVLALKGDFIYIIWKFHSITELKDCQSIYDKVFSDAQMYSELYRESKLTDTASLNKSFALEEEAWNKYCECYQKNIKHDRQFEGLQKQTEKFMQYIEK